MRGGRLIFMVVLLLAGCDAGHVAEVAVKYCDSIKSDVRELTWDFGWTVRCENGWRAEIP